MDEGEQRAMILEFEKNRQMLMGITQQKQQITMQLEMMTASLEELAKTKEKTVYKVVGNVLFQKDAKEMEKELKEKKDVYELRLKTVEKQEDTLVKKLNSIRAKIEGTEKDSVPANEKEEKSDKKRK
ncbi:MAG: prefoldin subunit [archaeon]|jgi:prefoldin beta subunit